MNALTVKVMKVEKKIEMLQSLKKEDIELSAAEEKAESAGQEY